MQATTVPSRERRGGDWADEAAAKPMSVKVFGTDVQKPGLTVGNSTSRKEPEPQTAFWDISGLATNGLLAPLIFRRSGLRRALSH